MPSSLTYEVERGPSLLEQIGETPILSLPEFEGVPPRVHILAKAEWHNPGGSVKDRSALNMIREGESSGGLEPGKTIIDATSGNTGIAYAMIGAAFGYRVRLAVPANVTSERKRLLSVLGADVTYTDPLEGTDGAQRFVKKVVSEHPEEYFYPDQYNNPANWQAHYKTTAVEIIRQTRGNITHFVGGIGTSGTFIGVSRRLKEFNPLIRCISLQPDAPLHGIEGLKHLQTAMVPGIYDANVADMHLEISTESTYELARHMAKKHGMLIGISSAAALVASIQVAKELESGVVVTVFPDHGSRYLSERFWSE
ncbi:MAG TPA: cysteine synthase family protein [Bacteroidota bacterium]|nr:cysteine synthase family protein [Bacteroidota bacterium]